MKNIGQIGEVAGFMTWRHHNATVRDTLRQLVMRESGTCQLDIRNKHAEIHKALQCFSSRL
jgi:hypothetical protein